MLHALLTNSTTMSYADISDHATEQEEQDRLRALQRRAPEGPRATGNCLFCGEPVEPPRRWCDAQCRDDYEAEQD